MIMPCGMTWKFTASLLSCALLMGCEEPPPKLVPVQGNVTLDGSPLPEGEVLLRGEGTVAMATLPVSGGQFAGEAQAGKYRVEVYSYITEAAKADETGYTSSEPIRTNTIPAKWNTESTLTAEILASGKSDLKFDVTSN